MPPGGRGLGGGRAGPSWPDTDPSPDHSQSVREAKAASHVLQTVWSYKELRGALQRDGWTKARFQVRPTRPFSLTSPRLGTPWEHPDPPRLLCALLPLVGFC